MLDTVLEHCRGRLAVFTVQTSVQRDCDGARVTSAFG